MAHRKPRPLDGFNDWLIGKWCDSFAAVGPQLVTSDEIPDPADLEMSLNVNGESEAALLGRRDDLHRAGSDCLPVEVRHDPAGQPDRMGTPGGVGDATGSYLQPGDVVVAEIEKLGRLENPVR